MDYVNERNLPVYQANFVFCFNTMLW